MPSVVLKVLGLTLGLFFIFVGTIKLTPSVNADIYKEMRKIYIRNSKVFPLVKQTGWKPNPHTYRKTVGSTEIISGAFLAFLPGPLKELANIILLLITMNEIYAHYALDEGLEKMSPAIVFSLLLTCRLVIFLQSLAAEPKSVFEKSQLEPTSTAATDKKELRGDDKKDQ
ncbi:Transmembrane protein 35A [Biomphalaria glabrata]|uniref:Novel acetylcholine receptor chaperone n=3 Tax=Biomphalaria TaxID=6525 RepID=A0A9W3ANS0_BIOGL|nr:novel acetylcholine receptor chaperone-like [Biomphalaria glabrata]KAI8740861.1 transmembrane protein 35A [Biomphalaria glabrata]KAI8759067.1 transmembrane protein 35A [Biomphalaria glabrata]KAK0064527.1 transmembrane protein 35A [Biomphalaria pfeifferi]